MTGSHFKLTEGAVVVYCAARQDTQTVSYRKKRTDRSEHTPEV